MLKSSKLRIWKSRKLPVSLHPEIRRRGARVVEEARLESVYTPKGYHEFESRSLRSLFHEILSDKGGCVGTTHPPFFLLGPTHRRAVSDWYTDYRQNPGGQSWLVPPGFLFRLSLRSGRHGLGRSCGLQSPLASAFLPHIFSVACSLPGRRATVRRFPFLHLLYDCFPAGLITISTAVRTGPFQHFPVCFPRLWSSSATASFTACGSGATLIAMRILDSISRRYSSSISSSVMYTQRKAMSAL